MRAERQIINIAYFCIRFDYDQIFDTSTSNLKISSWFKLYFLCIPTHEELQLQVFTDMYDIQNGIQKKVS